MPSGRQRGSRHHAILATKESPPKDCVDCESKNQSIRERLYKLNMNIPNWLSMWAILPLLEGFTRRIREVRDSARLRPRGRQNSVEVLEVLGDHVSNSIDIAAVVAELPRNSENPFHFVRFSEQFEPFNQWLDQNGSLATGLHRVILDRALWLEGTDSLLRDQLTQYGSILGAAENVRVQRKIGCLTWVLVTFGIVSLIMSLVAVTQPSWSWFYGILPFLCSS